MGNQAVYFDEMKMERTLAQRLGQTVHVSPLRVKIRKLMSRYPGLAVETMEDWLLDVANLRGVRSVSRSVEHLNSSSVGPDRKEFSNADLIIAICQTQNRDRPQWLRAAAELISRGEVDLEKLLFKVRPERVEQILAELSRQALIAEPDHDVWQRIHEAFSDSAPLSDSLIHWTRLTSKKAASQSRHAKYLKRPLAR